MDAGEAQARAAIAAALIVRGAVEVPTLPRRGGWRDDGAAMRLRELTDYVFEAITAPRDLDSMP